MRFFPSARRLPASRPCPSTPPTRSHRSRWLVAWSLSTLAVAALMVPVARADDTDKLEDQQRKVQGQIDKAHDHLDESSKRLTRLNGKLSDARGNLSSARTRLERVRGDLTAAKKVSAQLQRKLERAEQRFDTAVAELKAARLEVAAQREATRGTVIGIATGGNPELQMVSSYLESGSVAEIMINETGNGVVVGREQQALDALVAAEEALEEHRDEVKKARNAVASSKKAADENLADIKVLATQAADTRNRIAGLVVSTRKTRAAAVRAKAADKAALERLEAREQRIKQQILNASRSQSGSYSGDTGGLLHLPSSGPVTSPYGYRTHPIYGYYSLHNGTDFGAPCGSQLWAGAAGTVINTYYDEVYGNRLYLAIGRVNGAVITLVYNHLSSYAVGQGARVSRGQVVGYAGTTGWSTGCHLHFTVLRNGEPVDPMGYL
ncbi:M23 family metallopeptidase [Nocardioides sambongensis]|uniref:M23 family metallopeptidase n=1 Tax=Nocardioides sambongensis TaxID=2589074 RepID=UPI0011289949|nr:M23 family metallopeptidase [Nocardioides sambongensis]